MVSKIKTFFTTYIWVIWALLVALMVILFWFAFLSEWGLNHLFSSDALYLPALYRDFFQDGYTLNGWTLNQASNFFPDMLLFFMLNAIFGNFITATFCYSLIQYFAIIFIFYLIFKQLKPVSHPSTFVPAIFLFASYLFLYFIDNRVWESMLLNHNSYHNSPFIMALICIYLFLKYLDSKSWKTLIATLVLSILSGACDRLFFICFSIPVFLAVVILYFRNKDWKTLTKFLTTIALGAILAIALWIFFKNNPYFSLTKAYGECTLQSIRSSWEIFSTQYYGYLTKPSFILVLTYLSLFSYIATIIYVLRKTLQLNIQIKDKKCVDKMFVFQLFVFFFTPIVLLAPVFAGSYGGFDTMRYNYFPYFLLPFNAVVLANNWLNKNKRLRIILNAVLSMLIVGYLLINYPVREFGKGLENFFNFYPEKAKIIDNYFSDDETFKYGITDDYWAARQITMFSKKGIRLYSAFDGGDPWLHAANKNWFTDHDIGKHAHCLFSFLLWTKEKDTPVFFKENNDLQPVELDNWYLYYVKPYRFIMPGYRFKIDPVLIDESANPNK